MGEKSARAGGRRPDIHFIESTPGLLAQSRLQLLVRTQPSADASTRRRRVSLVEVAFAASGRSTGTYVKPAIRAHRYCFRCVHRSCPLQRRARQDTIFRCFWRQSRTG